MNLRTRRIKGSEFTAEDTLEVIFDAEGEAISIVVHSIELVSGEVTTHGGGALPGTYLHYKSIENDANAEGDIDYSTTNITVAQEAKGTSVVRVVCSVTTKAQADILKIANIEWSARMMAASDADEEFSEAPPTLEPTTLTTGEITLEWSDDNFV